MASLPLLSRLFLVLTIGWAALIYYLSDQPGIDLPSLFPQQDKFLHLVAYGMLGFFAMGSCMAGRCRRRAAHYWVVVSLVGLYGVLDEIHQYFVPGRHSDVLDVLADVSGGMLGAGLMFLLLRRYATVTTPEVQTQARP
ncbi:MAG: VanZ family protein [Gammaproteobacteria bacterium]